MEREPGIERHDATDAVEDRDDDLAWIASLPPCPGIPSTDEEVAAADAEAEADIAAGRVYPHSLVGAWLKTWGGPSYLPFEEWLKSSG